MDARIEWGDEPRTPRWIEWRLLIYPFALAIGLLALSQRSVVAGVFLYLVFTALMLSPLWIKLRAWGGVRKALAWMFQSNLKITREGYVFVALVIVFGTAAINTGTNLLYLILAMLLALMILSTFLGNMDLKGLRVSRFFPPYVYAGEEFRLRLTVSNPRRLTPALAVEARERAGPFGKGAARAEGPTAYFFSIEPGERRGAATNLTIGRRGVHRLEGFTLATRFPFGFAVVTAEAPLPSEVIVFPTPRELAPETVRALGRSAQAARPRAHDLSPDEFRSLREYRPGDNPRWIHWKSSARQGELMVKEFEARASLQTVVVLDAAVPQGAGDRVAALDRGCTLAVSVLEELAHQGEAGELAVQAKDEVQRFSAESRSREVAALLECLARLEPAEDPALARVAEAAAPGLRRGARVFVLTARDGAAVRRAIERLEPMAAYALEVLEFGDERHTERYYARRAEGDGNGSGAGTAVAGSGTGTGTGTHTGRGRGRGGGRGTDRGGRP